MDVLYRVRKIFFIVVAVLLLVFSGVHSIIRLAKTDTTLHINKVSKGKFYYYSIDVNNGIGSISTIGNIIVGLLSDGFKITKEVKSNKDYDIILKHEDGRVVRMYYDVKDMSIFWVTNDYRGTTLFQNYLGGTDDGVH